MIFKNNVNLYYFLDKKKIKILKKILIFLICNRTIYLNNLYLYIEKKKINDYLLFLSNINIIIIIIIILIVIIDKLIYFLFHDFHFSSFFLF